MLLRRYKAQPVAVEPVVVEEPVVEIEVVEETQPTEIAETVETQPVAVDYAVMTVPQLKELCEQRGLTGYAKLKKDELIALLVGE